VNRGPRLTRRGPRCIVGDRHFGCSGPRAIFCHSRLLLVGRRLPRVRSRKYWVFLAITLFTPLLLFGVAEVIARVAWPEGALPMFVTAPVGDGAYRVANRRVAHRWFAREAMPPAPMPEPFAAQKPARAFRVFVLGESSTAGFPYPRNGTFSRVLRDMLRDVLPDDSVEVINLGIAATNTYALVDIANEVLEQSPDAVLIYAGHNEYYGAFGAASTENVVVSSPAVKRAYLWLLRSRLVLALRDVLQNARTADSGREQDAPSLMETLARNREVPLDGETYRRGVEQFEANLTRVTRVFRDEGVPVFIGSLASNLRDQPPLAARANRGPARAEGAYLEARHALATGNATLAQLMFARARDLDVVRFRAPTEFNQVIERVTKRTGAVYVAIAEAAAREAPGGVPGDEFFLEHVHPNRAGYAAIARVFFESMRDAGFAGRPAQLERLRSPGEYVAGMELTAFDERIVRHTVRTLTTRWPFVPITRRNDYRSTYRPVDLFDSLAFAVSRGATWEAAKVQLAAGYERLGQFELAAAEYRGLVRDAPFFEEPLRLLARALLAGGKEREAEHALERALRLQPTTQAANTLAEIALRRRDLPRGISLLRQSLSLEPNQPEALHQLSLAYGLAGDVANARATALRLQQLSPGFPGLAQWLQSLGLGR
jgi:lysophospholipase L1-like esterase